MPDEIEMYISQFPKDIQVVLHEIRSTIRKAAPKAEEVISYQMPAYKLNGMLVWFAGHKQHLGFYPGANGIAAFKKELSGYKSAKGSVQFPYNEPLPLAFITKMVKFKMKVNLEKAKRKKE